MSHPNLTTQTAACQAAIRSEQLLPKQTQRKALARDLAAILDMAGYSTAASHIYGCGDTIIMRNYADGQQEVAGAMYCRERLCPVCQWRRSLKLYGQLSACMDALDAARIDAGKKPYRYLLLTLTMMNVPDAALSEAIDRLHDGFRALTRTPQWRASIMGAYRSTEIKRSSRSDPELRWHPHIHAVLCVQPSYLKSRKYITQEEWLQLWQRCAKLPYRPSVDIRALPEQGREGGVAEATKYVCKSDWYTLSDEDAVRDVTTLMASLRNRRLIAWYGNLRQMHRDLHLDDEDGDLINITPIRSDVAYTLSHYIWRNGTYMQIPMRASDGSYNDLISLSTALTRTRDGHYIPSDEELGLLDDVRCQLAVPDIDDLTRFDRHLDPFGNNEERRENIKARQLPRV